MFGVPESRLDALRARFPIDNPEHLFERALNEDQAALSTHILEDFKTPYRFVFPGSETIVSFFSWKGEDRTCGYAFATGRLLI